MKIDEDNQLGATAASASSTRWQFIQKRRINPFLTEEMFEKLTGSRIEGIVPVSLFECFPYKPMRNPVVVAPGETYDRANIVASSQRLVSRIRAVARNMGGDESGFMTRGEKNVSDILKAFLADEEDDNTDYRERMFKKRTGSRIEGIVPASSSECFPYERMRDPVVVAAGETYDRANIDASSQRLVSPMRAVARNMGGDESGFMIRGEKNVCDILLSEIAQGNEDERREATCELREMTKTKTPPRSYLGYWKTGAIPPLVSLLLSSDSQTQENAVTVLHNLSLCDENQTAIAALGAIPSIVQVLRNGGTMEARGNAAATLCNIAKVDENKQEIVASGAIPALVDLLRDGNPTAKNDALAALWILCRDHENRIPCVRAGMIPSLMKLLTNHSECLDGSLELLAMVADCQEGAEKVGNAGAVPYLMDVIRDLMDVIRDGCSPPRKAKAVAILHAICSNDRSHLKEFRNYRSGYIIALIDLSKSGIPKVQQKASVILDMIMKQEHISIKLAKEEEEDERLNFI